MQIICRLLCRVDFSLISEERECFFVDLGASKSIEECQYQFHDRHWNCSTLRDGTVFGPVISHGKS